jgi:ubiquinone biosynthesis protein
MKLSPHHLRRYKEIGRLFWKYGRSDLASQLSLDEGIDPEELKPESDERSTPDQLADDLEAMGPTYVKLGQVLSGRPDLLPDTYLKALERLQNKVKPFSFAEVEEIVTSELGVRISKAFARFDVGPIASASLGQVHSAELRDGRPVVVKVQRPNIRKQIADDFEVLKVIADFMDRHTQLGRRHHLGAILEEFRETIEQELNYEAEAQNLTALGENLKEFERIEVPQPVPDYSTRRVLTMDYVRGRKITSIGPLRRMELNGGHLADELFKAYLKQVLVDGLFHADPHPGNVFLTDDGRIALLDLGMVGRIAPKMQGDLLKLLMALSEGNGDQVADIVIRLSETRDEFQEPEFRRRLARIVSAQKDQRMQEMSVGRSLLEISGSAATDGLFVPSELTLLGKTLLQLDEVGKTLDPTFEPNASIRRNVGQLMTQQMRKQFSGANLFGSMMELREFVGALPLRINMLLDALSDPELEIKVKAVDATLVVEGFHQIANRITAGILLAALILGASNLMEISTDFRLLGYPALGVLFFLGAGLGAFWLVISIFIQDHRTRRKSAK